jgi:hypothetical protein
VVRSTSTSLTRPTKPRTSTRPGSMRVVGAPSLLEREKAMVFLLGTTQLLDQSLSDESRVRLLGGSMDLFQLTFLLSSFFAFQKVRLAHI